LVGGAGVPFLRSGLLDARGQLALRVLVEVEPELLRLDPDRVDPALLAEHDSALGGNDVGRIRLDRLRLVELARDRTRFAPEEVVSDEWLVRLELVARQLLKPLRERAHAIEAEVRLDTVA